jgi:hypothetical protein
MRQLAAFMSGLLFLAAQSACAQVGRRPSIIDWPAATADMRNNAVGTQAVRAGLLNPRDLDATRLPVLLPRQGPVRGIPQFAQQTSSYSAFFKLNEAQLSVSGSSSSLSPGREDPLSRLTTAGSDGYQFFATDEGADLAFSRYGANYLLRLTCDHASDVRCQKEDFLTNVAKGLAVSGGKPQ